MYNEWHFSISNFPKWCSRCFQCFFKIQDMEMLSRQSNNQNVLKVKSQFLAESLLLFELNSQTNTPLLSVLLQTRWVTQSISLSCARARAVTYYTEVLSGNVAKASVFGDLGWWLYPSHSFCFSFTEPGLCMNTRLFFQRAHTEWKASRLQGDILWIRQKVYWIRIIDCTFKMKQEWPSNHNSY